MPDVLDLFDDVIIQLQLFQPDQRVEVLYLQDICMLRGVLKKERERTLIFPKLICGSLGIILFSVR